MSENAQAADPLPHYYFSTFCIHEAHDQCRLTCKTCLSHCRCECHYQEHPPVAKAKVKADARAALITASHNASGANRWLKIKVREAIVAGVKMQDVADLTGVTRQTIARWTQ